jgi:hypothetical protein
MSNQAQNQNDKKVYNKRKQGDLLFEFRILLEISHLIFEINL